MPLLRGKADASLVTDGTDGAATGLAAVKSGAFGARCAAAGLDSDAAVERRALVPSTS